MLIINDTCFKEGWGMAYVNQVQVTEQIHHKEWPSIGMDQGVNDQLQLSKDFSKLVLKPRHQKTTQGEASIVMIH